MKAFSLLELSVVVMIMAVLMAGVTSGAKILRKAELYSTIKQVKEIEVAVNSFKEHYYSYPGDFPKAYHYFSFGNDLNCGDYNQCNGDGDGKIEVGSDKYSSEVYRSWQHLNLAELVKGQYSGIWGEDNSVMKAVMGGNLTILYDQNLALNILKFGNTVTVSGETSDGGILKSEDAEKIDIKIDDGMPNRGEVYGFNEFLGGNKEIVENYSTDCIENEQYKISDKAGTPCVIGFKM